MGMTRSSVRSLVMALVDLDNETYITSEADVNALINERIDAFAIQAKAFMVRPSVTVAAQSAVGPFSIDLRSFGSGVTQPTDVWIDGKQLRDLTGRPGPCSTQDLADLHANYLTREPSTVAHWSMLGPDVIELWPAPSAEVTVAILGTGLHGALAADTDATRFPTELDRPFCYDVAANLLFPRATGTVLERATGYASMASEAAQTYAIVSAAASGGRIIRGAKHAGARRIGLGFGRGRWR